MKVWVVEVITDYTGLGYVTAVFDFKSKAEDFVARQSQENEFSYEITEFEVE